MSTTIQAAHHHRISFHCHHRLYANPATTTAARVAIAVAPQRLHDLEAHQLGLETLAAAAVKVLKETLAVAVLATFLTEKIWKTRIVEFCDRSVFGNLLGESRFDFQTPWSTIFSLVFILH
ncbi:hypothetical protein VNO80_18406 [Phaseolus coccineus]|uniref:Uncharacterized protein n=1 Tax=Phaseolus coccineus TaxID=3886 RepID=A0AAN9MHN4_PHACN